MANPMIKNLVYFHIFPDLTAVSLEVSYGTSPIQAGWWFQTPLKNISQWEGLSHILWKIKNVPNHQPASDSSVLKDHQLLLGDQLLPLGGQQQSFEALFERLLLLGASAKAKEQVEKVSWDITAESMGVYIYI